MRRLLLAIALVASVRVLAFAGTPPAVAPALEARLAAIQERMRGGDYKGASDDAEALIPTVGAEYGPDSLEMGETLVLAVNLRLQIGQGTQPEVREMIERALAIEEKILDPEDARLAGVLARLGKVQKARLENQESKRSFERALAIRKKSDGPDHLQTALAHCRLADQLLVMSDYAAARVEYERAIAILEALPIGPDVSLALTLNNYALLFDNTGDLPRALELLRRAQQVAEPVLGAEHPEVVRFAGNVAQVYGEMGRFDESWQLYERVLASYKKQFGPDHTSVGWIVSQMGELKVRMGRPHEAILWLREGIAILEKSSGPDHPQVNTNLSSLAAALRGAGRLSEARAAAERSVASWQRTMARDDPDFAILLRTLGHCARAQGDHKAAVAAALQAEEVSRSFVRLLARTLSEEQALQFAAKQRGNLSGALAVAADGLPETERLAVWDSCIRTRGLVMEEMAARRQALQASSDPTLQPLWERFVRARQEWVDLIVRGAGERPIEEHRARLRAARDESEKAEEALASQSSIFRREKTRSALGLAEVRAALPNDGALVGYVRYDRTAAMAAQGASVPEAPAYLAFVLTRHESATVALGPAETIDGLVERWRDDVLRGSHGPSESEAACRRSGAALRRTIWDPIVRRLGSARQVFVVPDGALSRVNFAALPLASGRYLIEDPRLVHLLASERDLVLPETTTRGKGLLAFGDPAYDEGPRLASRSGAGPASFRGPRPGCPEFQSMRFEALAASRKEVASIVDVLREAGDPHGELVARTGAAASETAFKAEAPGHRILHLATHGFFLSGGCGDAQESTRGIGGLAPAATPPSVEKDPLLLSGIALAGANRRAEAEPGEDDGIVTAQEIASLDLTGVEWAVLSACDTGIGTLHPREGVLGLPRALRVAGARTTILSLWPVEDAATQSFMTTLYRARWGHQHSTGKAMREAALAVLRERRRAGLSSHPFYWAGFVAVGDWR